MKEMTTKELQEQIVYHHIELKRLTAELDRRQRIICGKRFAKPMRECISEERSRRIQAGIRASVPQDDVIYSRKDLHEELYHDSN